MENRHLRFSKQILSDLYAKALSKQDRLPLIGLYVHPDSPIRSFYEKKCQFVELGHVWEHSPRFNLRNPGMIRSLDDLELD